MAESFFVLSRDDQREVLEQVRAKTDRPTHLLEKDVWVVWMPGALFDSPLTADLTFKGGTSLSKAYKVIDRFSEGIDLTYDNLAALGRSQYFTGVIADRAIAASVAQYKSFFFIEKDSAGSVIGHLPAVRGHLNIVPTGDARTALADAYANMSADQVMLGEALSFDHLMQACGEVQTQANKAAVQ